MLKSRHCFNHGVRLRVVQESRFLLADTVFSAYASVYSTHIIHDKGLDQGLGSLLQASVLVAGQHHIKVQVAVTDMPMAIREDLPLLSLCKLG